MLIDYGMKMYILKMLLNKLKEQVLVKLFKEILVSQISEEKPSEKYEQFI